jgi:vitamin B12 transporter
MHLGITAPCLMVLLSGISILGFADVNVTVEQEPTSLEQVEVIGQRVANLQPAGTSSAIVTALRFDPQIDVQARGLSESQADITVRGGLFENTGFKLGAVSVFDPQTGHYSAELPIDPAMLSNPDLLTDSENSLASFNASVATINYRFADIHDGGAAHLGIGTDSLYFASARISHNKSLGGNRLGGLSLAAATSSGDGTLPFGDHEFKRFTGHFQVKEPGRESNMIFGYQNKFFGWPGAYTGFASLPETDHTKQGLLLIDHRRSNDSGWWEIGTAYRWLDDDYDFDRRTVESGAPGSFEHETRSFFLGLTGIRYASHMDWVYSAMLATDRLVRSTDLGNGDFNSRTYLSLSLAPSWRWYVASGAELSFKAGLRADLSNRDKDALMPLASIRWERPWRAGSQSLGIDVARTSQLPGYTALNSRPTGLFGGNPDLGREFANTLTISFEHDNGKWQTRLALFARRDQDLVDWTFSQGAPFARQANPVDLDVHGAEAFLAWAGDNWNVVGGYTFLDKDADYGAAQVDASYYALNFARHRGTLALRYRPTERLEFRLDNEYRVQQDNPLRTGDQRAWLVSFSAGWEIPVTTDLRIDLVADNLTDSDFEEFPGTPAYGQQLGLILNLDW